jgi:peptide/nickel transport system substrate-binding protein
VSEDDWQHMDSPALRQHWHRARWYGAKYQWIGWNLAHPLLSDQRVRKALTLSIDRPSIIAKLLYGLPKPTSCNFYWASSACDPALAPWPYDPKQAAQLLDAADVRDHDGDGLRDRAGVPFRFTLTVPSSAGDTLRVAAKIQEDLRHAGIEMKLETLAWPGFLARLRAHDFDATSLVWGGNAHTEPTIVWHSASIEGASNFIGYRNAEVDRLIDLARATSDAALRAGLYRQLGRILHEEQPYTFLFVPPELELLHARVKGARPSLAWWQFEELWLAGPRTTGTAPALSARERGGT